MNDISLTYYGHYRRIPKQMHTGRMSFHELTMVISGSMTYTVEGERYELLPKSAVFIPAGAERYRTCAGECDYVSFNFSGAAPELPHYMENAYHSEIVLLISALDRIASKPQLAFYERGAEILCSILSLLEDYERAERMTPLTLSILKYLHRNYKSRITLSDISDAFFFSGGYCEAVFSSDMGRSIIDYVLELRITEASRLIPEQSIALSAIAEEVGFSDYNYFSRLFKQRTGYTPTEYRKMMKA